MATEHPYIEQITYTISLIIQQNTHPQNTRPQASFRSKFSKSRVRSSPSSFLPLFPTIFYLYNLIAAILYSSHFRAIQVPAYPHSRRLLSFRLLSLSRFPKGEKLGGSPALNRPEWSFQSLCIRSHDFRLTDPTFCVVAPSGVLEGSKAQTHLYV